MKEKFRNYWDFSRDGFKSLFLFYFKCLWNLNIESKIWKIQIRIKKKDDMGHAKRIWYLSPMRAVKVQASLRIRAVSPEPPLLAHTSSESRGTFNQKARSLVPLKSWACAIKICHDGMLEDTNSLDSAHMVLFVDFEILNRRSLWCFLIIIKGHVLFFKE